MNDQQDPSVQAGAVVQLIARHQPRIRAFIRCLLVRSEDVDDLLQEVNLVLWEKAGEFRPGTDFWAWASQVARFKALNRIRSYSRERLVFDDTFLAELADAAERKSQQPFDERLNALASCLQKLPPAQRHLIDLRYASDKSIEDIAREISRPEGSLRQTLYRIRGTLLACIELRLQTAISTE